MPPAPLPAGPLAPISVPNIITPNGDSHNEQLKISGLVSGEWALTIYSRWGQQVYHSSAYRQDWDAAGLPAGAYYYRLHHPSGRRVVGWVEVMR